MGQAETHLREALQLADEEEDPGNQVTGRWNLAELLMNTGRAQSAGELAAEAFDALQHFGLDDHTLRAMVHQAKALRAQGRYPDSEGVLRRALARMEQAKPSESQDFADIYNELGLALAGQGQYPSRTLVPGRPSRRQEAAAPGRDSTIMLNQAAIYSDMGNARRAVSLAGQASKKT